MAEGDEGKHMGLYEKLFQFQTQFTAIIKDLELPAKGGTYGAVSENNVLAKVNPLLESLRLLVFPSKVNFHGVLNNTTTITSEYTWVDVDSGETAIMASGGQGSSPYDKGMGMALTYSMKYMFMKFGKAATGDDPDKISDYTHGENEQKQAEKLAFDTCMDALKQTRMSGAIVGKNGGDVNYCRIEQAIKDSRGNISLLSKAHNALLGIMEGKIDPDKVAVPKDVVY